MPLCGRQLCARRSRSGHVLCRITCCVHDAVYSFCAPFRSRAGPCALIMMRCGLHIADPVDHQVIFDQNWHFCHIEATRWILKLRLIQRTFTSGHGSYPFCPSQQGASSELWTALGLCGPSGHVHVDLEFANMVVDPVSRSKQGTSFDTWWTWHSMLPCAWLSPVMCLRILRLVVIL